jgi:translation initiation factor IF-3
VRRRRFNKYSRSQKRPENRINERIRAPQIRVVGPDGEQLGILPREEALQKSRDMGLDLVEVAPKANPPVCRVMDYGKFRYQQQKRAHEAKKKQTVIQVKEVKIRPKIDEHDYQFKLQHARRFLDGGDKAKVSIMFRGREIVHRDLGRQLLDRFVEDTADIGEIESKPKMEGRNMTMVLAAKTSKKDKEQKKDNQKKK